LTPPTCITALVRTTWLLATSTPVARNTWNPFTVTEMSYLPGRTNWM
jgi:hypothetical protein